MAFVPFKRKQDHHITGISCSINPFIAPTKPEKGDSCNLTLRATAGLRYVNRIVFMAQQTTNALSNQGKKLVNTQMSSINENMNMNRDAAAMNTLPILNARYRPLAFLGKGTFSQLIVAEDLYHPSKKHFAVKIMNPHCDYIGIQECQKIHVLNTIDPDGGCRVVKKPENVLLNSQVIGRAGSFSLASRKVPVKVKLVDFGNAMSPEDTSAYFDEFQVQSLYYRAPEVLLGSWSFGYPIDMWSMGCLLVELYTGTPLFRVKTPEELFESMLQILGPLPAGVFSNSKFYSKYVTSPEHEITVFSGEADSRIYSMRLERLKKFTGCKDKDFLDLVCSLLTFDPSQRLSAKEAIFHPFFNSLFPFTLVFREVASEFKDKRRSFFVSDGDDLRRDIMTSIFDSESKACINDEPEFSDFSDSDTLSETQHIQELPKTQVLFDFNPPKSQSSLEIQRRMRESEGAFVRVNKKARI